MATRPERLKATRRYPPTKQDMDETDPFSTTITPHPKTRVSYIETTPAITSRMSNIETPLQQNAAPKGYISRAELIRKLEAKAEIGNNKNGLRNPNTKPNGLPTGFVSYKEQVEKVESKLKKKNVPVKIRHNQTIITTSDFTKTTLNKDTTTKAETTQNKPQTLTYNTRDWRFNRDAGISQQAKFDEKPVALTMKVADSNQNADVSLPLSLPSEINASVSNNGKEDTGGNPPASFRDPRTSTAVVSDDRRVTRSHVAAGRTSRFPEIARTTIDNGPLGRQATSLPYVSVLIMNANGNNDKVGTPTDRRKQAISNIINKHKPHVVLFQEFSWKGVNGKTWVKFPLPENYDFKGHYDASLLIDRTAVVVQDIPARSVDTILSELQRTSNNRLFRPFPMEFDPIPRLCMTRLMAKTNPGLDIICISWHGRSSIPLLKKIEFMEYLLEFLRHLKERFRLPVLVAGDFNVDMFTIEHLVKSPFKLCKYDASVRRTAKGIIDFFIVTEELDLASITWLNLEEETSALKPNGVLDHDPVLAELKPSEASEHGMAGKRAFVSPIKRSTFLKTSL